MPSLVDWAIPIATVLVTFLVASLVLMKTEKDLIYRL